MSGTIQKYVAMFTPFGKAQALTAYSGGPAIKIAYMGIGDGDGEEYTPEFGQESLKNEWLEVSVHDLFVDENNPYWLVAEGKILEEAGGYWIREISLKDEERRTIAIASWPPTYKPLLSEGSSMASVIRFVLEVSDTEVFELKIDTSLALVTRDEFTRHIRQTRDVHGASVPPVPHTLVERDDGGRVKTATPITHDDAARLQEIQDVIGLIEQAGDSGVPLHATHIGDGVTTRFNLMGLLRDLPFAVFVTLDGVKQRPTQDYTVDLSGPVSAIVFVIPPPAGVDIELLTIVALTQYPDATITQKGVVKLATPTDFAPITTPTITRAHITFFENPLDLVQLTFDSNQIKDFNVGDIFYFINPRVITVMPPPASNAILTYMPASISIPRTLTVSFGEVATFMFTRAVYNEGTERYTLRLSLLN